MTRPIHLASKTKSELRESIKRKLGHPYVKVELNDDHLDDAIDSALKKYLTYAVGNATEEVYFTMLLSGGVDLYELPDGVVEVVEYNDEATAHGINTLFTIENYLHSRGEFDISAVSSSGGSYGLVSYHIAMDFLESLDRYTTSKYSWIYHHHLNYLQIRPMPETGNIFQVGTVTYDSPGWVLIKAMMLKGSVINITHPTAWTLDTTYKYLYNNSWVADYALAKAKITLGYIRRKFAGFQSIGNTGIELDGSDLISEGNEEASSLLEKLQTEEADGFPIFIG